MKTRCEQIYEIQRPALAVIRGVFALFDTEVDIPGFRCIPDRTRSLRERLDEILDDAYLLDASRMRRFIGLQSNVRAMRKDLRMLVAFISKNRPWAKGTVVAASQLATLATNSAETLNKVFEIFPELGSDYSVPVLIDPESFTDSKDRFFVSAQRIPFQPSESWQVTHHYGKGRSKRWRILI